MKILLSTYACRPGLGSEPGRGWSWARHLAQAGHEVYCFTGMHHRPFVEAHLREHPVARLHMVYVSAPAWVEWLRHRNYRRFLYLHYWHWQRAAYRRARHLHAQVDFDLVHHATYGSLQMGSRMGQLGIPFIFGPVGGGQSAPRAFRAYLGRGWYTERLRDAFTNSVLVNIYNTTATLRDADLVLTTNHETYARAQQWGARNVNLFLDAGPSPEFYPDRLTERRPTENLRLLWVGSMIARKGLPMLIDMMAQLPESITLTLVGDGPQAGRLKQRIDDLSLGHRITCPGRVPYEQVRHYYANHDVFVFSSLRDSFGIQLLEAMAHGLPVVTLDHQGAHTFVPTEAGIKVPLTDPVTTVAQMSQAVLHLQTHPEDWVAMRQAAYDFAQTQHWPRKVEAIERHYESFVQYS